MNMRIEVLIEEAEYLLKRAYQTQNVNYAWDLVHLFNDQCILEKISNHMGNTRKEKGGLKMFETQIVELDRELMYYMRDYIDSALECGVESIEIEVNVSTKDDTNEAIIPMEQFNTNYI